MNSSSGLVDPTRRRLASLLGWPLVAVARAGTKPLTVGPGERFRTLAEAVRAAGDGDTIELQPGDYRADVAVVNQPRLVIRGLGTGAVFHADGHSAQGKAILVVHGLDVAVENCEFRGARVPDGNGAGIRFESGRLAVRRCRFFDNEMGLLAANDPRQELTVKDCEFGAAPRHAGLLHHLLYVGAIGRFTLTGSRFGQGWRGHLVKTRALRSHVTYNLIDDGGDGEASYELEFPNGGDNVVIGNVIAQSPRTQNPTLLSMGAEARGGMRGSLALAHNTLVNRAGPSGRFIHVWANHLSGDTPLTVADNLFVGAGDIGVGASAAAGNHRIAPGDLDRDYRLSPGSPLTGAAMALPAEYTPTAEFARPVGTRRLPAAVRLSPGAMQSI